MTWAVSVISRDVEYNLSDNTNYVLIGLDGIGAAPVARIVERGPMQHGESDLGYRLGPRRIALALMARGGDTAAWFARREALLRIFRSSDSPVKLKIVNGDIVRQIDCYLSGTMEMVPDDSCPRWQKVGIELYCPDPTWYDPAPVTLQFDGGGGEATTVPTLVPTFVGSSLLDETRTAAYAGTWDARPVVRIVGPVRDARIVNLTTGDKLDFSGVTIAAGHWYEIDCRYGRASVIDDAGANKIADLSADSNLATFRIAAHPDVLGGVNAIRATGTNISAATLVRLTYHERYVGV